MTDQHLGSVHLISLGLSSRPGGGMMAGWRLWLHDFRQSEDRRQQGGATVFTPHWVTPR